MTGSNRKAERGIAGLGVIFAVIILGIVFTMALKGAALVRGARGFVTTAQFREFQDHMRVYEDSFRAVPGDDLGAPRRWNRTSSVYIVNGLPVSYTGDLRIQGYLSDYGNATGEQFNAWRDLRFAGIVDGDRDLVGQSAMPENLFGGVFGFSEDNFGLKDVICATQIPGDAAAAIDARLDDGAVNTGNVRATSRWDPIEAMNHFEDPDEAPYDPLKTYIICVPQRV